MNSTRTSATHLALGAALGVVALALTYGHQIGLGFSVYIVILLGTLLLLARARQVQPQRRTLLLLVPILFFTAMLTIRASDSLTLINFSAGIGLTLLLLHFFTGGNPWQQSVFEYPLLALLTSVDLWVRPIAELFNARRWLAERNTRWKTFAPIARGLLLTVPLVLVFVVLLSSADEVFSQLVARLLSGIVPRDLSNLVAQSLFVATFAWAAVGGLALAFVERKIKRSPVEEGDAKAKAPKLGAVLFSIGFTEAIMALGGVCLVFASFVVIQFVYLFGGQHNIANYSYADYVHRGFIELVAVAVLTLGVVFMLNETTTRTTALRENLFRGLSTLLIVLTGVILVSAFQRMRLYELAYGFTTLRLQIYVFIVWLGIVFAGFALSLYWKPTSINVFGVCALLSVIGAAATLDVLNPDAFVTAQNIQRGDIDPLYLSTLSIDAAPALTALVDAPEPGLRQVVRSILSGYWNSYAKLNTDIRDFNPGRANALAAIDSVRTKLDKDNGLETLTFALSDFQEFLKPGMTVRQVARQFGTPYWFSGRSVEERQSDVSLRYYLVRESLFVVLNFNASTGLTQACTDGASGACWIAPS